MIELLNNLIEIITYTPTLYVDGVACEMQCAWVWALAGLAATVAGTAMSAGSSYSASRKQKIAARKNYNMLMENAEMSKAQLDDQMEMYEDDMDSYRSSMIQRYGLAGGVRSTDAGLQEVQNYDFKTDRIDRDDIKAEIDSQKRANIKQAFFKDKDWNEVGDTVKALSEGTLSDEELNKLLGDGDSKANARARMLKVLKDNQVSDDDWSKKDVTNALGDVLKGYSYTHGQTNFKTPATNSAVLNLQESTRNMQRDINNAYKAGMIDYWQQRLNAQDVLDTGNFKAAGYSTQAQTTLASGFLSAIGYGAQAYTRYGGGSRSTPTYTSGGGVAQHQFG